MSMLTIGIISIGAGLICFISTIILACILHRYDYQLWKIKGAIFHQTQRIQIQHQQNQHITTTTSSTTSSSSSSSHQHDVSNPSRFTVRSADVLLPVHLRQQHDDILHTQVNSPLIRPIVQLIEYEDKLVPRSACSVFILSLMFFIIFMLPPISIIIWSALLYGMAYIHLASGIMFGSISIYSGMFAFASWRCQQWTISSNIGRSFALALISLLALTLVLTFTSTIVDHDIQLTFFARSIHFIALHFICVVELAVQEELEQFEALTPLLNLTRRDDAEQLKQQAHDMKRKMTIRKQRAKALLDMDSSLVISTDDESDEQLPARATHVYHSSDDDDDDNKDHMNTKLIELPSYTQSFDTAIVHESLKHRRAYRDAHQTQRRFLSMLGLLTLIAYALSVCYYYDPPVDDITDRSFDARFMGVLVAIAILSFDALLMVLTTSSDAVGLTKPGRLIFQLITRALLISCDDNTWFLSFAALYVIYSGLIAYIIIDLLVPFHPLTRNIERVREVGRRFRRLTLNELKHARPQPAWSKWAAPLMTSMSSSSSITAPVLTGIALSVLFLMSMVVAWLTTPPPITIDIGITERSFDVISFGFIAFFLLFFGSLSFLTVRTLFFHHFKFVRSTILTTLLCQLVYVGTGLFAYYKYKSLLVLCLCSLVPLLVLSLLYSYACSVKLGVHARISTRLAFSSLLSLSLIALVGVSVSVFSVTVVGWTLVCAIVILITSFLPAVKYTQTLELQSTDEWMILVSMLTLGLLNYLLQSQLALPQVDQYVMYCISVGYAVGVVTVLGIIDYHIHKHLNSWNSFAFICLLVYIIALGAASFAFVEVLTACTLCVAAGIVVILLALLLYVSAHSFRASRVVWSVIGFIVLAIVGAGVVGSYMVYDHKREASMLWAFAAFSAAYFILVITLFLASLLLYYTSSPPGSSNVYGALLHHAVHVLPVHRLDLTANSLSVYQSHIYVLVTAFLLIYGWCVACIALGWLSVGLSMSVCSLLALYVGLRSVGLASMRELSELVPFVDEMTMRAVHEEVWLEYSHGHEGEGAQNSLRQAIFSALKENSGLRIIHQWRKEHNEQLRRAELDSTISTVLNVFTCLWKFSFNQNVNQAIKLDRLEKFTAAVDGSDALVMLSRVMNTVTSHTYFLLLMRASSRRREEQARFAVFCAWLARRQQHDENVEVSYLDIDTQANEVIAWTPQQRRSVLELVAIWERERAKQMEENEMNRAVERAAHARRQMIIQARLGEDSSDDEPQPIDPYANVSSVARNSKAPSRSSKKALTSRFKPSNHHRSVKTSNKSVAMRVNKPPVKHKTIMKKEILRTRQLREDDAVDGDLPRFDELITQPSHSLDESSLPPAECVKQAHVMPDSSNTPPVSNDPPTVSVAADVVDGPKAGHTIEHVLEIDGNAPEETIVEQQTSFRSSTVDLDNIPLVIEDHVQAHAIFTAIQERFVATGQKWVDTTFPAIAASLYINGERDSSRPSAVHQVPVEEWKRPDEIVRMMKENGYDIAPSDEAVVAGVDVPLSVSVAADGFQCSDVVQGNIGSCYLLSALGVMAAHEERYPAQKLLDATVPVLTAMQTRHDSGCYLLRLHRQHRALFVVIDDLLPCQPNGLPAFSHCRAYTEIWVALIEKAYAKLAGCYESIEAGMVHQALADLCNGHCDEIGLHDESGSVNVNTELLWARLFTAFENGVMLGCGSNSGSNSQEVNGIVQGHAYAIKRLYVDSSVKLMQLFNPWGHGEWQGDWSDNSEKWTPFYKNKLGYVNRDDGSFWMTYDDFLLMYENVYLCRLMPHRSTFNSEWSVALGSAVGPRSPAANPHFVFRSSISQTVFIELEQAYISKSMTEKENAQYAYIQFYVVSNSGQRIQKIQRNDVKCWANHGKLCNSRTISAEFQVDDPNIEYTILCTTSAAGVETKFTMSIFSTDPVAFVAMHS